VRKSSSEENNDLVNFPSPYLVRKRKFQRFMHRGKSPRRESRKR